MPAGPPAAPDPRPTASARERSLKSLPLLLTLLRAALAPVVLLLAFVGPSKPALGICLTLAFLSDVFDGVLARRMGVATANLRRLDSAVDTVFYVAATLAVWHLHPSAISSRLAPLALLAGLEVSRYAIDWVKFRREASYHMWSSKLWGLCLFGGFFALLALGIDGPAVDCAIYVGIAADLEGLAISLALRRWQTDVPTIFHALRRRS